MLKALIRWAEKFNVPVASFAWSTAIRMARASTNDLIPSEISEEILGFLHGIQCPVVVLFGAI